jgi:hypothetical protein
MAASSSTPVRVVFAAFNIHKHLLSLLLRSNQLLAYQTRTAGFTLKEIFWKLLKMGISSGSLRVGRVDGLTFESQHEDGSCLRVNTFKVNLV